MKENLKKILYFFILFAYMVGLIGGFGYAVYTKAGIVIYVCIGILGGLAFPQARRIFGKLIE